MKVYRQLALVFFAFLASSRCHGEPTSGAVHVISLRPHVSSSGGNPAGQVYVVVDSSTFCSTNTFMIDLSLGAAKEMYAAALTALVNGKSVELEASNSTGCAGWGATLQSIYILNQ